MIVKMLRWRSRGFSRLVDYIGKESEKSDSFKILHNLRSTDSLKDIADQFKEQDTYRKERKNGTVIFHEILSFHKSDTRHLDRDTLEAIAREYIEIRCPKALAFAMPHHDREHVHLHIMVSGTEYNSSNVMRLSNPDFTRVKRQIEDFQRREFPELTNSIATTRHPVRNKELLQEIASEQSAIQECYDNAHSLDDFFAQVEALGVDQSKYQLDNSGHFDFEIDTSRLQQLDERMSQLSDIQRAKEERDIDLEDGFEREL